MAKDTKDTTHPTTHTAPKPVPVAAPAAKPAAAGETITQNKPSLAEGVAQGGAPKMSDIGKGSVTEEAPAVRGSLAESTSQRVVQQGNEVIVHTRSTVGGQNDNHALVVKVNQGGTINVRVQLPTGQLVDIDTVYSSPQNGEHYWSWPAKNTLDEARKSA